MKKVTLILLCIIVMTIMFPITASADTGPKPSVVIDFKGLEGKVYYATLLSSVPSTGPFSAINNNNDYARYKKGDDDYEIFTKFAGYQDNESFYFLQFFKDCTQTHRLSWTYYPPKMFKILLYLPETDSFIESDTTYERYAFDSYFIAEVAGSRLSVEKSYKYSVETLSLIVRIILTIIVELGIAIMFGFRERKQILFITLVNVITQVALNFALNVINFQSGKMAFIIFYFVLEVAVFITEAILYNWYLKKNSHEDIPEWKPSGYALTANTASFALGIVLSFWVPSMF